MRTLRTTNALRSLTLKLALVSAAIAPASAARADVPARGQGGAAANAASTGNSREVRDSREAARKLFEEGIDLEKRGEFAQALKKYKDAEQIAVTAGLRFHTGYCLEMNGKLAAALEAYEEADKLAVETNKIEIRPAIAARLDPLRARVPQLTLHLAATAKHAAVLLDGETPTQAALDGKPFRIAPGPHSLTATAPGYNPFRIDFSLSEGSARNVEIAMESPTPVAAGDPWVVAPAETSSKRSYVAPVLASAGTLALAATGVVAFVLAGNAKDDGDKTCATKTNCDDEQSKVRTLDAIALGGFIGAAALGAVSVVLWTSGGSSKSAAATPGTTKFVASPTSFGIEGAF